MARISAANKWVCPLLTDKDKDDRHKNREALAANVCVAKKTYAQLAVDISRKHGRTMKWSQTQLFLKNKSLLNCRRVSLWNAFLRARLHEVNKGCEHGKRVKLTKYIAENKTGLLASYNALSPAQHQEYVKDTQAARETKQQIVRANPKAISNTVASAFTNMDHEWTSLCMKTGIEGFYIAVHGSVDDLSPPMIFFSPKAERFVKAVLNVEPNQLALRLESWVISGMDMPAATNHQRSLNKLISECHTHIQEELDYILAEKRVKQKVKMNYDNYKCEIVERHSIALTGWPLDGPIKNPGKVGGRATLEKLLGALESEKCKWITLKPTELAARIANNRIRQVQGEIVYKPRKPRHTEGTRNNEGGNNDSSTGKDSDSDAE